MTGPEWTAGVLIDILPGRRQPYGTMSLRELERTAFPMTRLFPLPLPNTLIGLRFMILLFSFFSFFSPRALTSDLLLAPEFACGEVY